MPKLVEGKSHVTMVTTLWNKQMEAHKTIRSIKPDITIGVMRI